MKSVVIRLDAASAHGASLRIWDRTVLERLRSLSLLEGFGLPMQGESGGHVPANLVCSTLFFREYLRSGQTFEAFAGSTRRAFVLCTDPDSVEKAKKILFKDSKKPTDGWVSTKINARISIPISRLLAELPIHPNWITLLNVPIAIGAAWCVSRAGHGSALAAGALFQFASIFDGCDGEIARTKLQVTRVGGWLDTATDNLAYVLFFLGIGVWAAGRTDLPTPLVAMLGAVIFLVLSLLLTYVGMRQLGTQTHHAYRAALERMLPSRRAKRLFRAAALLSKRENFALGIFILCVLDRRDVVYWTLLPGLIAYGLVICGSFPALIRSARTALGRQAVPGAPWTAAGGTAQGKP